jgi:hypothetical protein
LKFCFAIFARSTFDLSLCECSSILSNAMQPRAFRPRPRWCVRTSMPSSRPLVRRLHRLDRPPRHHRRCRRRCRLPARTPRDSCSHRRSLRRPPPRVACRWTVWTRLLPPRARVSLRLRLRLRRLRWPVCASAIACVSRCPPARRSHATSGAPRSMPSRLARCGALTRTAMRLSALAPTRRRGVRWPQSCRWSPQTGRLHLHLLWPQSRCRCAWARVCVSCCPRDVISPHIGGAAMSMPSRSGRCAV